MDFPVIVAVVVFCGMSLLAVLIGIIAAISAVSGFDKPDDRDE